MENSQNLSAFMGENFSEPTFKYSLLKKDKHGKVLNWEFTIKKIEAEYYVKVLQYFSIFYQSVTASSQMCHLSDSKKIACPSKEMLDLLEKLHPEVMELLASSVVEPSLKNAKLQDSYKKEGEIYPPSGAKLLERMLTGKELLYLIGDWVGHSSENSPEGLVEEVKNSTKPETPS